MHQKFPGRLRDSASAPRATRRPAIPAHALRRAGIETLESRRLLSLGFVNYAVGPYPQAALTADFNHDGRPDLATANGDTVSVLLGKGDGTFEPAVHSHTDTAAGSMAVGDFDGDGNTDLATTSNNAVGILLGTGDGTLRMAGTVSLPAVPVPDHAGDLPQAALSVAVGDLTGDGKLDLAVTAISSFTTRSGPYTRYDYWGQPYTYYAYQTHNNGHVDVLVGNGSGNFTPPAAGAVQLLAGSSPGSVVLEELDGVAGLDLVTADASGAKVRVLSGNNDGTFDAPVDYTTRGSPTSFVAGDVNGDGISDLIAGTQSDGMTVLLGNGTVGRGDGTFRPAPSIPQVFGQNSLAVGDFDADGKLDLVATSSYFYYGYESQVHVLLGHGNGTFAPPWTMYVSNALLANITTGDFNGDGFSDAAVTDRLFGGFSVLINDQFWPPTPPPTVSVNDVAVTEGNAGSVNATFTVSLSGYSDVDVTVHYDTANGTASAGSDYTAGSGDVTIPAGQLSGTFVVAATGDRVGEPNETFTVNLSAPLHATLGDAEGTATIVDDEPRININSVAKTEGNGGTTQTLFTVTLSAAYDQSVTVRYATSNGTATAGSDYQAKSGTLTFAAGVTSMTIAVDVTGDRSRENNETFFVNLSGASSNASIGVGQGIGTILDDDRPARSIRRRSDIRRA